MRILRQIRPLFALLALGILLASQAYAEAWTSAVSELAQRIATKAGPGTAVTLSLKNISSLSTADVNSIRTQLNAALISRGLRIVTAEQSVAELRVTLSENGAGYVWIAEIRQGNAADVVFTSVPRAEGVQPSLSGAITLQRRMLWAQEEPILDLALTGTEALPGAIVLTRNKVTYYRISNSTWQEADSAPITHSRPLPRDVRGMIIVAGNNPFEVALPGAKCTISGNNPYRSDCVDTDDPWPINDGEPQLNAFFSPARNFFTGAVSRGVDSTVLPPFYSAAKFGNSEWLFAGTDGRITYTNFVNTLPMAAVNWGSEIASIKGKCSPDAVVLTTRDGDYTQPDAVQGFQIIAREPIAITVPVEFAGPVTVLRGAGEFAIAVSHNLKTGRYEAYSISLACNQ
jgi:hypothetical protein